MKNKRLKLFGLIFILTLIISVLGINLLIEKHLPDELKMYVNKEKSFGFYLPIDANLEIETEGVVKLNNKTVPGSNFTLDLNESFTLESNETGVIDVELRLFGLLKIKTLQINVIPEQRIAPAGLTVGVTVQTDGILVLGMGYVYGEDGKRYSPAKGKLYTGDYIKKINDIDIIEKDQLIDIINENRDKPLKMEIIRNDRKEIVTITPVKTVEEGSFRIGIWVRDDTQGIGTITYVNFDEKTFGALGHGITDVDTKQLIDIKSGEVVKTMITTIKRGQKGNPGEISGIIISGDENHLGEIVLNSSHGIFGDILPEGESKVSKDDILPLGFRYDIYLGEAYIRSDISGELKDYKIMIKKIYLGDKTNKGMIIEVVDKELLKKTNGIIQGMSGSPIIQGNKLIGAVTHVFVQDSTKGYGTFIENMLIEEKDI